MNDTEAKKAIDSLIKKARVHLYKPIQIAEILYRHRVKKDISLLDLETYRNTSKRWRDEICSRFLGKVSTSSARFQDDLFNQNAMPPKTLNYLGQLNQNQQGIVEAYIYRRFLERMSQMNAGLDYCRKYDSKSFFFKNFSTFFGTRLGCAAV